MVFLFKKTKLFVLVAVPLWIFAVVVARLTVFTEYDSAMKGILNPVLFALCGAYFIYMFAALQANRTHRAYNELLSQECDVERYLELYAPLYEEGKKHRTTVYLTESSYATALHLDGRSDEAREIVRALIGRPDFDRQRAVDRADAYVDEGIYSVALGDLVSAREAVRRAEEVLASMGVGAPDYNRIYREVTRLRYRADVADGIYDEALEYFTDTSREYTTPYAKVNRMNTLAQIYRGKGELRKLKQCLGYMAKNGGTLRMAKDARVELESFPELPEEEVPAEEGEDGET